MVPFDGRKEYKETFNLGKEIETKVKGLCSRDQRNAFKDIVQK